jgi:hypothetical protein
MSAPVATSFGACGALGTVTREVHATIDGSANELNGR